MVQWVEPQLDSPNLSYLRPRPPDEMKELAIEFYQTLGSPLPCSDFKDVWYTGDGRHWPFTLPAGEAAKPRDAAFANQKQLENRRARNKICVVKLSFYNLFTKECVALTPAVWCACADRTQSRRYYKEIMDQLAAWREGTRWICAGVLDGGFYHGALQDRMRWITPIPEDDMARISKERKPWCQAVNNFVNLVRGPNAETRFADQVNQLRIFQKKFRLGMPTLDKMVAIAEALLNINRRLARNEVVGELTGRVIHSEEAAASPFFTHEPTYLDDIVRGDCPIDEEHDDDPFEFVDKNDVPLAIRAIFHDPKVYHRASTSAGPSRPSEIRTRFCVPGTEKNSDSEPEEDEADKEEEERAESESEQEAAKNEKGKETTKRVAKRRASAPVPFPRPRKTCRN